MDLAARFLRFAVIGGLAFVLDVSLLYLLMSAGMGPYLGRAISILAAATFTWQANRRFTFQAHNKPAAGMFSEWVWYMAAMVLGGGINYAVYAILITWVGVFSAWPVLAVVVGTGVSMLVNFTTARWILERPPKGTSEV